MKKQILFLAVATSLVCSCKKSDNKENPSGNQLSALETKVVGKWQLVSSIDSSTSPAKVTDVTQECEKDDVYTFSSDKSYTINDGANECTAPKVGGSWKVGTDSLFKAELMNCLCSAYPVLVYISDTKMVLRNRNTSLSNYTINTFRKL